MRELKSKTGARVTAGDEKPSPHYEIYMDGLTLAGITFQDGPIKEVGINGVQEEDVLLILADRLRSFQGTKYACRETALALTKIDEAIHWLRHRTENRIERGVEGTSKS